MTDRELAQLRLAFANAIARSISSYREIENPDPEQDEQTYQRAKAVWTRARSEEAVAGRAYLAALDQRDAELEVSGGR